MIFFDWNVRKRLFVVLLVRMVFRKCRWRTCFCTYAFLIPFARIFDCWMWFGTCRLYILALSPTNSFGATDPVSKLLVSNKSRFSPMSAYKSFVSMWQQRESVCEQQPTTIAIFGFQVVIEKSVHDQFWYFKNGKSDSNWFIEGYRLFCAANHDQILIHNFTLAVCYATDSFCQFVGVAN